jgi:hypothetical protein
MGAPDAQPAPSNRIGPPDIPGIEDLPPDVRERLRKARRDPTKPEPAKLIKQAQAIRVGSPAADDLFRTCPDETGWFPVHTVVVKRGFEQAARKKVFLVGPAALTNPAVAERARPAVAILTVTAENIAGVWVLAKPDMVAAENSYPYDQAKWECAQCARANWVTLRWDKEQGIHRWSVVDLTGQPNDIPVWPAEHPLILIDRAISTCFIDDPDFGEFKNLVVRSAAP